MMLEIVPERVRDDFVKAVVLGFALERARPSLVIFELSPRKNTRDPVRERNRFGNRHCASSLLKPLRYAKRRGRPRFIYASHREAATEEATMRLCLFVRLRRPQASAPNMQVTLRKGNFDPGFAQLFFDGEIQVAFETT